MGLSRNKVFLFEEGVRGFGADVEVGESGVVEVRGLEIGESGVIKV